MCPGKGFANVCMDNNGPMVLLSSYINKMMTKTENIRKEKIDDQLPCQDDEELHVPIIKDPLLQQATQPTFKASDFLSIIPPKYLYQSEAGLPIIQTQNLLPKNPNQSADTGVNTISSIFFPPKNSLNSTPSLSAPTEGDVQINAKINITKNKTPDNQKSNDDISTIRIRKRKITTMMMNRRIPHTQENN